jgi:hypothetical protein
MINLTLFFSLSQTVEQATLHVARGVLDITLCDKVCQ